jgi:demethylmenaquinone methyltransferase/2-methoxy-6-polyprenyl-1,4-benzoquinol methylase
MTANLNRYIRSLALAYSGASIHDNAYRKHAKHYDFALKLYRCIGLRHEAYLSRAIELLHLQQGDSVIDLGCGTGLSFPRLIEQIGPEGRLIGVDLTLEMLESAKQRIKQSDWNNIELIQSDIANFDFPEGVKAVLSVGAFGYIANYDQVIEKASQTLIPGGRIVILDGKMPEHWPLWLFKIFVWFFRPFQLNLDYFTGHPWESVERFFEEATLEELYGGLMYISSGTAPSHSP